MPNAAGIRGTDFGGLEKVFIQFVVMGVEPDCERRSERLVRGWGSKNSLL